MPIKCSKQLRQHKNSFCCVDENYSLWQNVWILPHFSLVLFFYISDFLSAYITFCLNLRVARKSAAKLKKNKWWSIYQWILKLNYSFLSRTKEGLQKAIYFWLYSVQNWGHFSNEQLTHLLSKQWISSSLISNHGIFELVIRKTLICFYDIGKLWNSTQFRLSVQNNGFYQIGAISSHLLAFMRNSNLIAFSL